MAEQVPAEATAGAARPRLPRAEVVHRVDITDELMVLKLRPTAPYTYKAGQYCTLGRQGIERAYSLASAPEEELLEVFVELVPLPDGVLTPIMWDMKVGDTMSIRPRAKGIFTLDQRSHKHVMVATVTGVSPYVGIVRSYLKNEGEGHHFYILQGASYQDEFTYRDELEAIAREHPDVVTYVPTVSRPNEEANNSWQGAKGRVNTIVEEWIKSWGLTQEDVLVYACGHPGMIEDLRERLEPKGYRVKEERFWKQ